MDFGFKGVKKKLFYVLLWCTILKFLNTNKQINKQTKKQNYKNSYKAANNGQISDFKVSKEAFQCSALNHPFGIFKNKKNKLTNKQKQTKIHFYKQL